MQRRSSTNLICARILCLLVFMSGYSIDARAERLPLKVYTTADGLANNEVNKIVRDSRGFLWFCTAEGLSRFDGYQFTNYTTDHGLPHVNVTDFLETRGGEIWLATNGGLVRFDPKGAPSPRVVYANGKRPAAPPMFTVVVPEDEHRYARAVAVLLEARDGTIWCGTLKGLHRLERGGDRLTLQPVDMGMPEVPPNYRFVTDLLEDRHGSLWVAAHGGLYRRWPDGSVARYTKRDGLPDDTLHDLFVDHRGRLWAGTRYHGFFQFTADETHAPPAVAFTLTVRDLGQSDWINQLFETSNHRLWAATANGLLEFIPDGDEQGRRYRLYTTKNGLAANHVTALNEDPGGNIWLGINYNGAMKLAREGFVSLGEGDGLSSVYAVFGDRTGGVCFRAAVFGDKRASVFEGAKPDSPLPLERIHTRYGRFDGRSFTWLKPDLLTNDHLGWVGGGVTLQARNGEWWLGTGVGLYRFPTTDDFVRLRRARPLAVYTDEVALPAVHRDGRAWLQVFRLFEDSRGDVWVSTISPPNGLARWERASETWHDLANAPNLPSPMEDLARVFGEDSAGNVWVGFNGGAARYRDGSFTFFDAKDGLPPGSMMSIHADRAGRLWLTSARSGLIRVDDPGAERPVFVSYTTAEGLSSNSTEAITEDLRGRIYVSTGRGLDRLDPATGRYKHFTTADGLAPGRVVAASRDRDGVLWFATSKGLSRFLLGADDQPAQPPPILITALSVAGERQLVSALGETEISLPDLAPDRNQLQIDFVGLSFAPGELLRYQYRLEGADADWAAPTEQRTVNFASLAPGSYRFMVRAVNSDDVASLAPATITFTVLRPFWQRAWFVALAAMSFAALAFAAYRYRVAQLLKVERVRTRIATDLHDDIGANLTKIAILSEVAQRKLDVAAMKEDGAGDGNLLSDIAETSRESVSVMSDIVWAINPKKDSMLDLTRRMRAHAQEVLERRDIRLKFNALTLPASDLKLDANTRRNIYLIFKESLNNVARHADAGAVEIDFGTDGQQLVLRVADDGKGFDVGQDFDGNGLLSMKKRASDAGGNLEINSRDGAGTCLALRVPLPRAFWR